MPVAVAVAVAVPFVVVLNLDPLSMFPVEAVAVRTAVVVLYIRRL